MTAVPPIVGTESYIAFAEADGLAADRLNAIEWRAAVAAHNADEASVGIPSLCRQALMTATATLDRLAWAGAPSAPDQALAWPRRGFADPSEAIPQAVATACAELAFHLLTTEGSWRPNIQMVMIGQAMETYFAEVADELPKHVRRLIEPLLIVGSKHSAALVH